tara:strand:- start:218 stop:325 length:108 start_codon:yes stop_codon:yes gene_type:complete
LKIIAFVAHPDDLEPQIGGSVAKFAEAHFIEKWIT